jgi:hypothetical protein
MGYGAQRVYRAAATDSRRRAATCFRPCGIIPPPRGVWQTRGNARADTTRHGARPSRQAPPRVCSRWEHTRLGHTAARATPHRARRLKAHARRGESRWGAGRIAPIRRDALLRRRSFLARRRCRRSGEGRTERGGGARGHGRTDDGRSGAGGGGGRNSRRPQRRRASLGRHASLLNLRESGALDRLAGQTHVR